MLRAARVAGLSIAITLCGVTAALAAKRVALVIGNSSYQHTTVLKNPKNDAKAVAALLTRLGFEVVEGTDLEHRGFGRTITKFSRKLRGADVALFYYAGHGLQVNGRNYLVPVDSVLEEEAGLEFEAVRLRTVLSLLERRRRTSLVFLDACRNNPLTRNLARSMGTRSVVIGRGFAREETGIGTLIAFATQPDNVAYDGEGDHSPFTRALLDHLETPGMDVALVMRRVRQDVIQTSNGQQVPWSYSSLTAPFVFKAKPEPEPRPVVEAAPEPRFDPKEIELAFWKSAQQNGTRSAYEVYLQRFPQGTFAGLARLEVARLTEAEARDAEQRKQAAEERREQAAERRRQDAERQRLAEEARRKAVADAQRIKRERDDLMARLKAVETRERELARAAPDTKPERPEQEKSTKIAALETEAPAPERKAQDPYVLTVAVQSELKRVGCYRGKIDGKWGKGSRGALARYTSLANRALSATDPTREALDALEAQRARVCPLECGPRYRAEGDICVKKSCGRGKILTSDGHCIARTKEKDQRKAAKKKSRIACGPQYRAKGGRCVKKKCARGKVLKSDGRCIARAKAKKTNRQKRKVRYFLSASFDHEQEA